MKKTYIIPEMFSVQLGTCRMMAGSQDDLHDDGNGNLVGGLQDGSATGDGLAKGVTDVNVWDEEW